MDYGCALLGTQQRRFRLIVGGHDDFFSQAKLDSRRRFCKQSLAQRAPNPASSAGKPANVEQCHANESCHLRGIFYILSQFTSWLSASLLLARSLSWCSAWRRCSSTSASKNDW